MSIWIRHKLMECKQDIKVPHKLMESKKWTKMYHSATWEDARHYVKKASCYHLKRWHYLATWVDGGETLQWRHTVSTELGCRQVYVIQAIKASFCTMSGWKASNWNKTSFCQMSKWMAKDLSKHHCQQWVDGRQTSHKEHIILPHELMKGKISKIILPHDKQCNQGIFLPWVSWQQKVRRDKDK